MAINETITLQGVPQVKDQLAQVTAASQQTSAAINQIGAQGGGAAPIQNVFVQLKQGADSMKTVESSSGALRLSLNALRPALSELGLAMGPIREFGRLAAESFVALGAAAGGAAVVSLTKFNEELQVTKARLDALTGGTKAFEAIQAQAARTGVSIQTLSGATEGMVRAFTDAAAKTSTVKFVGDAPAGSLQGIENIVKLTAGLAAQLQAAGLSAADSLKAINAFSEGIAKTGTVTGDALRALQVASPQTAKAFAELFGGTSNVAQFAAQLDKVPLSLQKINLALSAATPALAKFTDPKPVTAYQEQLIELGKTWEDLKTKAAPTADQWSTDFLRGINFIIQHSDQLPAALKDIFSKSFSELDPTQLSKALDSISFNVFGTKVSDAAKNAFQALVDSFSASLNQMKDLAAAFWANITQDTFSGSIEFSGLISAFQSALQTMQSAWENLKQTLASDPLNPPIDSSGFIPFGGGGFASGGLVHGPGTATSDSILARVSAGEFIMSAAATQRWGASFLAALNSLQAPRLMPAATTGLPRFAQGGAVEAPGHPVHLHIDTQSFSLTASEHVATALARHAVKSRLVSTGRKPSWY